MGDQKTPRKRIDLSALKAGGFIKQCQPNLFAVRLRIPVGDITASQLQAVSEIAQKYGQGRIHLTARQGLEINDINFDDFDKVQQELKEAGLSLGACGARVRVVTGCPGKDVCPKGLGSTKQLGKSLDDAFFGQADLGHKFKMGVAGCPNSCVKPQENDLGFNGVVEPKLDETENECISCNLCEKACATGALKMIDGRPVIDEKLCDNDGLCIKSCPAGCLVKKRAGWNVTIGGRFGRKPNLGQLYATFVKTEDTLKLTDAIIKAYRELGNKGERLGVLVERIGLQVFKKEVEVILG
jgi:dissimilatory sulfite reductase (desulfoviridin) alpha/beta subunit